ncbi:MAG TPA: penicillin-binding protein 2 [Gemmatimonadales bacterium]
MSAFQSYLLDRRLRGARLLVWATMGIMTVAFFRTQILGHGKYELQSETNRLRPIPLPAARGVITDRNGRVLAENVPGYSVALLPGPIAEMRAALGRMAPIVKLDAAAMDRILERHRRAPYHPVVVVADASFEVVSALEERRTLFPGLVIQTEPKRRYPDNGLAAHLVGYVGEVTEAELASRRYRLVRSGSLVGKDGLERMYDDSLRGSDGVRFVEVNALGYMVREADEAPALQPVPGPALHTTIDLDLQRYIASIFPDGQRGAVIAMNPNTGEILALYSAPGFDPNAFVGGVDPRYWRALNDNPAHPLLNRAIQARYPPGSAWKLALAAMALKRGIVSAQSHMPIPCRGGMPYGNRFFRCWRSQGHGHLSLTEAIAHSCDVYFYQLGLKVTLANLLEDGNGWGFRRRTGIDLPGEIASEFPSGTEYYDRLYGPRRWTSAVTLNLAIGQGENAQTLINAVRLYQMLATDGAGRTPYVVRARERGSVSLGLTADQLGVLRQAMRNVVEQGTGGGARLADITIAGKTSTAQNPQGPDHGWFIGFGPVDKPEIVVAAIIEFARHGSSVAPLVARTIARYLGADSTVARQIRLVLPRDSAPEPIQLLPGPIVPILPDTLFRDTTSAEPPARD